MEEIAQQFLLGIQNALLLENLLAVFIGVAWGIVAGALPGITPSIGMALLLPFTFALDPGTALVMLASVYVGSGFGSSIPAILINTPGAPASAATVLDGYQMQRQGQGARALGISLYAGFVGGVMSVFLLILFVIPLGQAALQFGPAEYAMAAVFGLTAVASIGGSNWFKSILSMILGLALATVGPEFYSGAQRYTYGLPELMDGVESIFVVIGIFALGEVFHQASQVGQWDRIVTKAKSVMPSGAEIRETLKATMIGGIVGTIVGVLPGAGSTISAFIAYAEAKRWSSHPEKFGKGSPEGVAAPESANNAVSSGALVPLLALGIPGSVAAAIMMAGLILHGVQPGPLLFRDHQDIVYLIFASMFVAQLVMLGMGYLTIRPAAWIVNVPKPFLLTSIVAIVAVGTYSVNNSGFDVAFTVMFGLLGYGMIRWNFNPAAFVLAQVLGELIETNVRRALVLSDGSWVIFIARPISLVLVVLSIAAILWPIVQERRRRRSQSLSG